MADAININNVVNLPQENTLLINYSILLSGNWDLKQEYTAYRNVCDDVWTVMYPNFQHPLHTDFPISVTNPIVNATFAWNYGGIRGITSENFDENHSYLTQLTIYNIDCIISGQQSGIPRITGNPNITGNPTDGNTRPGNPEPRARPVPRPPRPPEPPTIRPPIVEPPGSIRIRPPGDLPGDPPGPDPVDPGRRGVDGRTSRINPGVIDDGFPRNSVGYVGRNPTRQPGGGEVPGNHVYRRTTSTGGPENSIFIPRNRGRGSIGTRPSTTYDRTTPGGGETVPGIGTGGIRNTETPPPYSSRYRSRSGFETNNNNYQPPIRRRRDLNYGIEDIIVGRHPRVGEEPIHSSEPIDYNTPLDIRGELGSDNTTSDIPGGNYVTSINPVPQNIETTSYSMDNILEGAETKVEVGKSLVLLGERIVASGIFRYPLGSVSAKAQIVVFNSNGVRNVIAETDYTNVSYGSNLSLSTSIQSSQYLNHCVVCFIVKDTDGNTIGIDSKLVSIVPSEGDIQLRQPINYDQLPDLVMNYANLSKDNYTELEFYQNETKTISLSKHPSLAGELQLVLLGDSYQGFNISLYNATDIPEVLEVTSSDKLVRNGQQIYPEAYNTYVKGTATTATNYTVRISPKGNNDSYHYSTLFISKNWKTYTPTTIFTNLSSSTATISFSCAYGSDYVKLIVNGKERGKYSTTSYTSEKLTSSTGGVTFTSATVSKGDWVSFVLRKRGKYNIVTDLIYEVQYT